MQHVTIRQSSRHRPGFADYVRQVGVWVAFVRTAMTVARERRSLMALDDRMLKDIGIGRSQAYSETCKRFGDIPRGRSLWP